MAKRIFRNMVLTVLLAVLFTAILIVPTLYHAHESSMSRQIRQEADIIAETLEIAEDDIGYLKTLNIDSRITFVSADGVVLFDSETNPAQMENHAGRPEIAQALENGSGEHVRTSATLAETTVYYAVRTADGYVLRISNTRSSMLGTFLNVLPMITVMLIGMLLIALAITKATAGRIVEPINALNLEQPLDNNAYDELAPLLTRMHQQHMQIQNHVQLLLVEYLQACVHDRDRFLLLLFLSPSTHTVVSVSYRFLFSSPRKRLSSDISVRIQCDIYNSIWYVLNSLRHLPFK